MKSSVVIVMVTDERGPAEVAEADPGGHLGGDGGWG